MAVTSMGIVVRIVRYLADGSVVVTPVSGPYMGLQMLCDARELRSQDNGENARLLAALKKRTLYDAAERIVASGVGR
jgi:hypothetical protein